MSMMGIKFRYNAELLCADEIGFKVVVSMPVMWLSLSFEACEGAKPGT